MPIGILTVKKLLADITMKITDMIRHNKTNKKVYCNFSQICHKICKLGMFLLYMFQLQCTPKAEISTLDKKLKHKVNPLFVIDHFWECHCDIFFPFDLTLITVSARVSTFISVGGRSYVSICSCHKFQLLNILDLYLSNKSRGGVLFYFLRTRR